MQLTKGKVPSALKIVVYGPEGIGKSTFASKFPGVVFCDTEGSTKHMDVSRTPKPSSFAMIMEQVRYFIQNPNMLRTFVLDTADWAERLCSEEICAKNQVSGIEGFGYGKGYTYLYEEFGRLLNLLEELIEKGVNVVITSHAKMRKFEQPDEMGTYDRWELKLQKGNAPLLKEWADIVLFANYKTFVVNVDGQGADKGKNKAQGGKRVMYASHHPCWDAKNRHGLPDNMPFDFSAIEHLIIEHNPASSPRAETLLPPTPPSPQQLLLTDPPSNEIPKQETTPLTTNTDSDEDMCVDIPPALLDLMRTNNVKGHEIQFAVAKRGYYPNDTPISCYDPNFVKGVLINAWTQVFEIIKKNRDEIPF